MATLLHPAALALVPQDPRKVSRGHPEHHHGRPHLTKTMSSSTEEETHSRRALARQPLLAEQSPTAEAPGQKQSDPVRPRVSSTSSGLDHPCMVQPQRGLTLAGLEAAPRHTTGPCLSGVFPCGLYCSGLPAGNVQRVYPSATRTTAAFCHLRGGPQFR